MESGEREQIPRSQAFLVLVDKIAKALGSFASELGSRQMGSLSQAWLPEPAEDGRIVLNTQGLPYCIVGTGDLLALFRCISCKYKFTTDTAKTGQMGPVGRVYTTGEPELTQSVQQYDQDIYVRKAEAQRCQVNCCLFLPIYDSSNRGQVSAVLEVVQTEENPHFVGLARWAKVCLENAGLWTIEGDVGSLPLGLRAIEGGYEGETALESKVKAAGGTTTLLTAPTDRTTSIVTHTNAGASTMLPPPPVERLVTSAGIVNNVPPQGKIVQMGNNVIPESNVAMLEGVEGPGNSEDDRERTTNGLAAVDGDRMLTLEDLRPHFRRTLENAAEKLGIGVATLKRTCRRLGLKQWPRRELAMGDKEATDGALEGQPSSAALIRGGLHSHTISNGRKAPNGSIDQNALPPPLPMPGSLTTAGGRDAQTQSLESLDILAAADVDVSVGNGGMFGGIVGSEGPNAGDCTSPQQPDLSNPLPPSCKR